MSKTVEQPFERHPELASVIRRFANNVPVPGSLWNELLNQINNALTTPSPDVAGSDAVAFAEWTLGRYKHIDTVTTNGKDVEIWGVVDCDTKTTPPDNSTFTTVQLYAKFREEQPQPAGASVEQGLWINVRKGTFDKDKIFDDDILYTPAALRTGVWVKASDRLPKYSSDNIVWKNIEILEAGMGFDKNKGFDTLRPEWGINYTTNYAQIEWLDESGAAFQAAQGHEAEFGKGGSMCQCPQEDKPGQTTVWCCNNCGLPDEKGWGQPAPAAVSAGDPTAVANSRWPHETKEENEYITEAENRDRELIRRGFVWGAEWESASGIPDVQELVEALDKYLWGLEDEAVTNAEREQQYINLNTALAGFKRK